MSTIQDTVGRLAIAKENIVMGGKIVSQIMHTFFEREEKARPDVTLSSPTVTPIVVTCGDIDFTIERLEMAIHDLKIVKERVEE